MRELFKLQYGEIYLQVSVDKNFLESVDQVIAWLNFLKTYIKQQGEKGEP